MVLDGITDNEQVEAKNKQLTAQNKQLTAQNEQLTAQNEQLTAKNEQLTAKDKQLAAENEKLTAQNEKLAAKNMEFENILINAANHINAIEKRIREFKGMHQSPPHQAPASTESTVPPEPKKSSSKEVGAAARVRKRTRLAERTNVEVE